MADRRWYSGMEMLMAAVGVIAMVGMAIVGVGGGKWMG